MTVMCINCKYLTEASKEEQKNWRKVTDKVYRCAYEKQVGHYVCELHKRDCSRFEGRE